MMKSKSCLLLPLVSMFTACGGGGDSSSVTGNTTEITNRVSQVDLIRGDDLSVSTNALITYTPTGVLATRSYDDGPDGVINELQQYESNELGQIIFRRDDVGVDAVIDQVLATNYDEAGVLVSRTLDTNADGVIEFFHSYIYDQDGLVERFESRDSGNTLVSTSDYSYDTNNKLTERRDDTDADGIIDDISTYVYDGNELLISETSRDASGVLKLTFLYTYEEGICDTSGLISAFGPICVTQPGQVN